MGKKRSRVPVIPEEEIPEEKDTSHLPPKERASDEPLSKKSKWENRERVLVFCSRGITARQRHLMGDLRDMMPHARAGTKHDTKHDLKVINEVAEIRNCNLVMYFEARSHDTLFLWISDVLQGPSIKFQILNVHTLKELKFSGNCLKGSRPILYFGKKFDSEPHLGVVRSALERIFNVPTHHPRSQPFFDQVIHLDVVDNRIWFRKYQILHENGELAEIGPQFVLNPVKILSGSFSGATLWENPKFKTPASRRALINKLGEEKTLSKDKKKQKYILGKDKNPYKKDAFFEDLYEH